VFKEGKFGCLLLEDHFMGFIVDFVHIGFFLANKTFKAIFKLHLKGFFRGAKLIE